MPVIDKLKSECEWAIKQIDEGTTISVPETRSFFSLVRQTIEQYMQMMVPIRCKECKHRPYDKRGHGVSEDLLFPDDVCPLQSDDPWYSKYPEDDFFCAKGERKYEAD